MEREIGRQIQERQTSIYAWKIYFKLSHFWASFARSLAEKQSNKTP
jgi:hypothetical protein